MTYQVTTYFEAIKFLKEGKVLVYKINGQKLTYLTLVKEDRIACFNENLRYNISFKELQELMNVSKVFIFEREDIETAS